MENQIKINTKFAKLFGLESATVFSILFKDGGEMPSVNTSEEDKPHFEVEIYKHKLFNELSFIPKNKVERIIENFYRLGLIIYGDTDTVYNIRIEPNFYDYCKNEGLI